MANKFLCISLAHFLITWFAFLVAGLPVNTIVTSISYTPESNSSSLTTGFVPTARGKGKVRLPIILNHRNVSEGTRKNSTNGGRVIRILNSPIDKVNCVCVVRSRCSIQIDQIKDRRDTVCPNNLIQCCGQLIEQTKRCVSEGCKDDEKIDLDIYDTIELPEMTRKEALVGKKVGEAENSSVSSSVIGEILADHQLPVQLPVMKIPTEKDLEVIVEKMTPTIAQPPLPFLYTYPSPAPYEHHRYAFTPIALGTPHPIFYSTTNSPLNGTYRDNFIINFNGRGLSYPKKVLGSKSSNFNGMHA